MRLALTVATLLVAATTCCGLDLPFESGGGVPDELAAIPAWPGATFTAGGRHGGRVTGNWSVTDGRPDEVIAYYRTNLEADGWSVTAVNHLDGLSTLRATRGDRELLASATNQGDHVLLSVSVGRGG